MEVAGIRREVRVVACWHACMREDAFAKRPLSKLAASPPRILADGRLSPPPHYCAIGQELWSAPSAFRLFVFIIFINPVFTP